MVQMSYFLATQMNAANEGNPIQVSTCQTDACSLSKQMRYSVVQKSTLVSKCKAFTMKMVEMRHLTTQINGLHEGNLTQVSACQFDARSLSHHIT